MALPAALLSIIPDIVKNGINLLDRKFPSAVERQRAEQEYQRDVEESIQAAWDAEQSNLTQRHASDMQSDSWLSKNVRPLALVYLMALFTLAFFTDVPESVLEMLRDLLMTVFIFYFGARSFEKITKMVKG